MAIGPTLRQILRLVFDAPGNRIRTSGEGTFSLTGLRNGGIDTNMTAKDNTWIKIERSVSTTPTGSEILSGRNSLKITNKSSVNITTTINPDPNGTSQAYIVGDEIFPDNSQFIDVSEKTPANVDINIWVRSVLGDAAVFFREIA